MSSKRLADIQKDAIDARSRLTINKWQGMGFDVNCRLADLKNLIGPKSENEIHRHIVVSLIAALQTYVRGTIISICDLNQEYRIRAASLIPEKMTMTNALEWIGGSTATFGELVAHMASCNSTTDIFHWLDGLLGTSVKGELIKAVSPYDQRHGIDGAKLIVANVDATIAELQKIFDLRHILAHEAAPTIRISRSSCADMWDTVNSVIDGIDAVLWSTAYKHLPLTQLEMNVHAIEQLAEAIAAMQTSLQLVKENSDPDMQVWLDANQAEWKKNADDWYSHTYRALDGTMWPSVATADESAVVRARTEQLRAWAAAINPSVDTSVMNKFSRWLDDAE